MTTLYRLIDAEDRLLYIGIAGNPGRRFEQHADDKTWWSDVARITLEHHVDRGSALQAERAAIVAERPIHNVQHNRPQKTDTPSVPFAVGDVVALGLEHGQCPVGLIGGSYEAGGEGGPLTIDLSLYSWFTTRFTAGELQIPLSEIVYHRKAVEIQPGVFDMDPLATFQIQWQERAVA